MKLVRSTEEEMVFGLSREEHQILHGMLSAYPIGAKRPAPLAAGPQNQPSDELLDEVLEEHRKETKARLARLMSDQDRLRRTQGGWQLRLRHRDIEWFLQVLNDVRVGSWLRLGSPGEIDDPLRLFATDPEAFMFMETAGVFEMQLLNVLRPSSGIQEEDPS